MGQTKKGDWRAWIRNHGIKKTADELGVHYETVRLWANTDDRVPKDSLKKMLVSMSDGAFGFSDFF